MYIRFPRKLSKMKVLLSFFSILFVFTNVFAQDEELQAKKDSLIQNDSLYQVAEAERHYNKGVTLMEQDKFSQAISEFDLALNVLQDLQFSS